MGSLPIVRSGSIQNTKLLATAPLILRLYVLPFLVLYLLAATLILYHHSLSQILASWSVWAGVYVSILLANGLCYVATVWSPRFCSFVCYRPAQGVASATHMFIQPVKHKGFASIVSICQEEGERYFYFQQNRFLFDASEGIFFKPKLPVDLLFSDYQRAGNDSNRQAVSIAEAEKRFGLNSFHIPQPTFLELFKEHAIAPFFLFQVFCVTLWMLDDYWYYSAFTLVMLVIFECTVVFQRITSLREFKTMSIEPFMVKCRREGRWLDEGISTSRLVPGDVIRLELRTSGASPIETIVPCDLLLLSGACVVNEAMLSGESTPLQKGDIQERDGADSFCMANDKSHILFGGTKVLQISSNQEPPANSTCLCFVLRTGFHTSQGKLVRTMLHNSENVTANNRESFLFILFLMIFAIAAAIYVWREGIREGKKSHFKLLIECVLIVTQVIPPELPMELSLAVNASLFALSQFGIFCTEPFRIPVAGKIDVCCLDKTGTITEEQLVVQGVVGLRDEPAKIFPCSESLPLDVTTVLAGCHSVMVVQGNPVGDPMEVTSLQAIGWSVNQGDVVTSGKSAKQSLQILKRFSFSSALKRMSVVCVATDGRTQVLTKGAPEVIRNMLIDVPEWYDATYEKFASNGDRVLALAMKQLKSTPGNLKNYSREIAESDLKFVGFLLFSCPLKADSTQAISSLLKSRHYVVIITGDNLLTGVHVANTVGLIKDRSRCLLLDVNSERSALVLVGSKQCKDQTLSAASASKLLSDHSSVAVTGCAFDFLTREGFSEQFLRCVCVFARTSPLQKEAILLAYKEAGLVTLMCGDGTNDVGALKRADIGIALLDGNPGDLEKIKKRAQLEAMKKQQQAMLETQRRWAARLGQPFDEGAAASNSLSQRLASISSNLEEDRLPTIRLGDASIAAPFTSKISTLNAICSIIKQGRCTLVTTIQMYKILALNSLISAYSMSVLQLEGVRYSDCQNTLMGLLITFCFLFLSKGKPFSELSAKRPQSNIFNRYLMSSILGQFTIHLLSLMFINRFAKSHDSAAAVAVESGKFQPSLTNSLVYLISIAMQVCTFINNYQGRPFRESLNENSALRNSLLMVMLVIFALSLEWLPELNEFMQIVRFSATIKIVVCGVIVLNIGACALWESIAHRLFANEDPKEFFRE